ncbi:lipid IV(A) 3-deoxy-D-manno-octulosonic acid transferase [Pseudaeromonas sp. ZJS20]|uniref:lipid IV(A) 3-deoxy-D-manno-octulosonic acid transferase n=1 Tax=Pseudaeromonas aegiceratis TaxID=3153928 RepID=UPI00390C7783
MLYRLIYTLLIYLALPVVLYITYRPQAGKPGYGRRWKELLGWVPPLKAEAPLWIHTVSVGESLAAMSLIRQLKAEQPDLPLLVTTTTRTGADQIARLGDLVEHRYAPLDYPGAVARFLNRTRPRALVIMETELWPNWLAACGRRQLPVVVMNARLSERSCQRYQKVSGVFASMSRQVSLFLCQHRDDAARFLRLGVPQSRVQVTGSLKYDIQLDPEQVSAGEQLRRTLQARPVWIAASTHPGEDELLLAQLPRIRAAHPDSLLILVPRHPARFEPVAALCQQAGFALARRSRQEPITTDTAIYLADTMGEMPLLLQMSDLAFMGGSLVPVGGHNLLEPASLGKPTLIGPHSFNFADVTHQLCEQKACRQLADAEEVAAAVCELLGDAALRQQMGMRAFDVVAANQGAQRKTLQAILGTLAQAQAQPA